MNNPTEQTSRDYSVALGGIILVCWVGLFVVVQQSIPVWQHVLEHRPMLRPESVSGYWWALAALIVVFSMPLALTVFMIRRAALQFRGLAFFALASAILFFVYPTTCIVVATVKAAPPVTGNEVEEIHGHSEQPSEPTEMHSQPK